MSPRNRRKENPYTSPLLKALYSELPPGVCVACEEPLQGRERRVHRECYRDYQRIYGAARRAKEDPLTPIARRLRALEALASHAVARACKRLERAP